MTSNEDEASTSPIATIVAVVIGIMLAGVALGMFVLLQYSSSSHADSCKNLGRELTSVRGEVKCTKAIERLDVNKGVL